MITTRSFPSYDPFISLISQGTKETIETFLATVSDPKEYLQGIVEYNQVSNAPIFHVAEHWNPNIDVLDLFLSTGVNIDCRNSLGKTALHSAAEFHNLPKVKYLLQHGADLGATHTSYGNKYTPLILAAYSHNKENKNADQVIAYLASRCAPGEMPLSRPDALKIYKLNFPSKAGRVAVGTLFSKEKNTPPEVGEDIIGNFLGDVGSHCIIPVTKVAADAAGQEKKDELARRQKVMK